MYDSDTITSPMRMFKQYVFTFTMIIFMTLSDAAWDRKVSNTCNDFIIVSNLVRSLRQCSELQRLACRGFRWMDKARHQTVQRNNGRMWCRIRQKLLLIFLFLPLFHDFVMNELVRASSTVVHQAFIFAVEPAVSDTVL